MPKTLEEIENLRRELHLLASQKSFRDSEVLELSKKLDAAIVEYEKGRR